MANFQYCLNASTIKATPILKQITVTRKAGYEANELGIPGELIEPTRRSGCESIAWH